MTDKEGSAEHGFWFRRIFLSNGPFIKPIFHLDSVKHTFSEGVNIL